MNKLTRGKIRIPLSLESDQSAFELDAALFLGIIVSQSLVFLVQHQNSRGIVDAPSCGRWPVFM